MRFYIRASCATELHRCGVMMVSGQPVRVRMVRALLEHAPVGTEGGIEQDWLGVPMFFDGIGATGTLAAIEAVGLVIDNAEQVVEDGGQASVMQFLWVLARWPVREPVHPGKDTDDHTRDR